ncbi:MAG TPA: hypothetical protein VNO30_00830 [Kofleriaceae bacterium]|nr:hypothetical protein [Kofleriaceae bacterium]
MTEREMALIEFIETRLESMLSRPEVWGSNLSVEEGVLQLLEIRRVLLQPSCRDSVTHQVMRAYSRFVRERLDQASAEPLALQLEDRGRPGDFIPLLREFVEIDQADSLVQLRALQGTGPSDASESEALENAERVLAILRYEAIAKARRSLSYAPSPFIFSTPQPDQQQ